jgi:rubredoxin
MSENKKAGVYSSSKQLISAALGGLNGGYNDREWVHKVHTVNFYQNNEKIKADAGDYFTKRFKLVKAAYEFAKYYKVNEGKNFDLIAVCREDFRKWLQDNYGYEVVIPESASEYESLISSVVETIASFSKNKYIVEAQRDIKELLYKRHKDPEFVSKGSHFKAMSNEARNEYFKPFYEYSAEFDDLRVLTFKESFQILKYELIEQSENLRKCMQFIEEEESFEGFDTAYMNEVGEVKKLLLSLNEELNNNWLEAMQNAIKEMSELKKRIENGELKRYVNTYSDAYVTSLYLNFDILCRQTESGYLSSINSGLNYLIQKLPDEFASVQLEWSEDKRKSLMKLNFELWSLDFSSDTATDKFKKTLDKIIKIGSEAQKEEVNNEDKEEQGKDKKQKSVVFLRHPKSAPSFPKIGDNQIVWNKSECVSSLFNNSDRFSNMSFNLITLFDSLFIKAKRQIEASDVYKVTQFLSYGSGEKEVQKKSWQEWLLLLTSQKGKEQEKLFDFINKEDETEKLRLFIDGADVIKSYKSRSEKFARAERKERKVFTAKFWYDDKGAVNNRLPVLTFSSHESDKLKALKAYLQRWLTNQTGMLLQGCIELQLIRDITGINDLLESWFKICDEHDVTKTGAKKSLDLYRNTEERHKFLEDKWEEIGEFDAGLVAETFKKKLQKYETHLFLDRDWNGHDDYGYQIFDYLTFKKYLSLSEVVMQAFELDKKTVAVKKAVLRGLTGINEISLGLSATRMTADKPQGKSNLVFEIDPFNPDRVYNDSKANAYILFYPMKFVANGLDYKIKSDLESALKEYRKGGYRLMAGFLNGGGDNHEQERINDKTSKGRILRSDEYKLSGGEQKIYEEMEDEFRKNEIVSKGATNPAGYPRLYYFLIPQNCHNLVLPVRTNSYYLNKYTPYGKIREFLQVEQKIKNAVHNNDEAELRMALKEQLQLRCQARFWSRLSSIEVRVKRTLKLEIEHKKAKISPFYSLEAHLQCQNPIPNPIFSSENREYKTVLGVDLGEKILACATLLDVEKGDEKWSVFLPVSDNLSNGENEQKYRYVPNIKQLKECEQIDEKLIDPTRDKSWQEYATLESRYRSIQKRYGKVPEKLRQRRDNLTDLLAEKIAVQIAKIAKQNQSLVVFEDLASGFTGSKSNNLRLYTAIRRATISKMLKLGLISDTGITQTDIQKLDTDKNWSKGTDFGVMKINAPYTSRTCANCGFIYKVRAEGEKVRDRKGIFLETQEWQEKGILKLFYSFDDQKTANKLLLTIKHRENDRQNPFDLEYNNKNYQDGLGRSIKDILVSTEFYKVGLGSNNLESSTLLERLKYILLTEKEKRSKLSKPKEILNKLLKLKNLINVRPKQDYFCCPNCGYNKNADYNASYNIAKKGLDKLIRQA